MSCHKPLFGKFVQVVFYVTAFSGQQKKTGHALATLPRRAAPRTPQPPRQVRTRTYKGKG